MNNQEDYIELHRLLAKCKFELVRICADLMPSKQLDDYMKIIRQIDEFIVDIPIIIKGDER